MRKILAIAALASAVAAPSATAAQDLIKITYNPWVVCVTEPCPQPFPVTVCVLPSGANICLPDDL